MSSSAPRCKFRPWARRTRGSSSNSLRLRARTPGGPQVSHAYSVESNVLRIPGEQRQLGRHFSSCFVVRCLGLSHTRRGPIHH
ncbi:unnamed protein product [Ectocarpus sp. 12 AP-2014]